MRIMPVSWAAAAKVAVIGGLLVGLQACDEGQAEDTPTLQTASVSEGNLAINVEANGLVEPIRIVEVKSKAGGEVLSLTVDIGDVVSRGDLLAEIDPRDVQNAFDQAFADQEAAQARLDVSQASLNRSERLVETGVITEQEHENAVLDFANARTALVRADANLELAELRLQDVTIRAANFGTILTKAVEVGTVIQSASGNVSGGTTLFTMASLAEMQVRTLIDETDIGQVEPGMEAMVRVEAYPEREFVGVVEKIEPQAQVEQNVTMFPVIVHLDNSSGLLRPGMNAEVEVHVAEQSNVMLAQNGAIVQMEDASPAAEVLGLDPTAYNFRTRDIGPVAMVNAPAATNPAAGEEASSGEPSEEGEAETPSLAELREMVQSGEITQDSMRTLVQSLGLAGGRQGGGGFQGAGRQGGGFQGGGRGGFGGGQQGNVRPAEQRAMVFVVNPDGSIEPRIVRIGLNDYDNTAILEGVAAGEQLALIGPAQLQAQRQAQLDRFRSRAGGGIIPGGGGRGR